MIWWELEFKFYALLQVVSYGISINLVEVTWKGKIKQQFPNPNDYSSFMGDFSSATGLVTAQSSDFCASTFAL